MVIRTSKPNGNKFYITKAAGGYSQCIQGKPTQAGANVLSNCVGYACGRFNEIIGSMRFPQLNCNAENFIERAQSLGLKTSGTGKEGDIMVWQKGATLGSADGAGHACMVERVNADGTIYTSESSWGGTAFFNQTRNNKDGRWGAGSAYTFRGFVVNPATSVPTPPPAPTPTPTPTPQPTPTPVDPSPKIGDKVTSTQMNDLHNGKRIRYDLATGPLRLTEIIPNKWAVISDNDGVFAAVPYESLRKV